MDIGDGTVGVDLGDGWLLAAKTEDEHSKRHDIRPYLARMCGGPGARNGSDVDTGRV